MGIFSTPSYGAQGYLNAADTDNSQIRGLGRIYSNTAGQAMQSYGAYDPQYQAATNDYATHLKDIINGGNFTDQNNSAFLNNYTSDLAGDMARMQANSAASLAARGMGGGASSMQAGDLASIGAYGQGQIAAGRNALLQHQMQQREQAYGQLPEVYGQAANTYYGRGQDALSHEMGAYNTSYGNNMQQGQLALQRQAAARQQMMQALSGIATVAGGAIGGMPGAQIGSSIFGGGAKGGGGNYGY